MHANPNRLGFAQGEVADAIHIWNSTSISLLDIRHNLISPQEAMGGYRLPASAFVFTSGGKAEVSLNSTSYHTERFGLFHGAKGAELAIQPRCQWLEYYMVLYKAGEPPFYKRKYSQLLEKNNPFQQQYGFAPKNPVFFSEELRRMYEKWKGPTPLNCFYGKVAFYRFVYEVYEELERGNVAILEPDVVTMAQRYLKQHYNHAVSIQDMCEVLGTSYSHFYRNFKQQTGKSPQEYLIEERLSAAKKLLKENGPSIPDVASFCGFQDERNFQRLFSKHVGMTPNTFRENTPPFLEDNTMGNRAPFSYNWEDQVSLGELREKGAIYMRKQMRSKAVIAAALSLMLLLSACGTAPANSSSQTPVASAVESQMPEIEGENAVEEGTRTIQTTMGEVEIPVNPKRIVVDYLIGDVVALGVVPVGVSKAEYAGTETAFSAGITESASVGEWDLELESVMSVEPDLILLAFSTKPYEDLSKIAPTVVVPYGEMTTAERIAFVGDVLGRSDEAEKVIASYNQKIQQGKQKLADAGLSDATLTIGQFNDNGNYLAGSKHAVGVIAYNELGIAPPEKVQTDIIDADQYWGNISMEVLAPYCGDYILTLGELTPSIKENAVWNLIPAVGQNRLFEVDTVLSWYTDIMSAEAIVDIIVEGMIGLSQ